MYKAYAVLLVVVLVRDGHPDGGVNEYNMYILKIRVITRLHPSRTHDATDHTKHPPLHLKHVLVVQ